MSNISTWLFWPVNSGVLIKFHHAYVLKLFAIDNTFSLLHRLPQPQFPTYIYGRVYCMGGRLFCRDRGGELRIC